MDILAAAASVAAEDLAAAEAAASEVSEAVASAVVELAAAGKRGGIKTVDRCPKNEVA